jgi:heme exporter protein A
VGLSVPESGSITWDGVAAHRAASSIAGHRVYIAHASALKDDLSISEGLRFLARLHGRDADGDAL